MTAFGTACLIGLAFLLGCRRRSPSKHFLIISKLNSIMQDLTVLNEKVTTLEAQVAEFQTALDKEQTQVQTVLDSNSALKLEVEDLKQQLADAQAANDPAAIQAVVDRIDGISQSIIATKADLEATIADQAEEPGEEESPVL